MYTCYYMYIRSFETHVIHVVQLIVVSEFYFQHFTRNASTRG